MAPLHRGVRGRISSTGTGDDPDWRGGGQRKSFLDVVGRLLVFLPLTIFNLSLVLQSSCLEV